MKRDVKTGFFAGMTIVAFLALVVIYVIIGVKAIRFDIECEGHLKRAADANSVELAKQELKTAVDYLFWSGRNTGYTSVLWKTPDEDVTFWYNNLESAYRELEALPEDATPLEKTNVLMKLRETLTDDSQYGVAVTVPDGISRHPHNAMFGWLRLIAWVFVLFGGLYCVKEL